jgi:hypothetical protein
MTRPITIADCRAWGSCYTVRGEEAYLIDLFPAGEATPRAILDESRLSLTDRGWILSRALAEWDSDGLVAWARESADLAGAVYAADAADYAADYAALAAYAAANDAATRAASYDRTYRERLEACVARLEAIQ